jgi:hypothetical protein
MKLVRPQGVRQHKNCRTGLSKLVRPQRGQDKFGQADKDL